MDGEVKVKDNRQRRHLGGWVELGPLCLLCLVLWPLVAFSQPGPDSYEVDDSPKQARVFVVNDEQHHNFHDKGDEDWVEFCGLEDFPFEIIVQSPGSRCDAVLNIYDSDLKPVVPTIDDGTEGEEEHYNFICNKSGTYYVRVRQYDPEVFGSDTEYDLVIRIGNNPPLGATVTGIITEAGTEGKKPIGGVTLRTDKQSRATPSSPKGGYYLATVGNQWIKMTAEHKAYQSVTLRLNVPGAIEAIRKDFTMKPLALPDLLAGAVSGPSAAKPGESILVSNTVKNSGSKAAGPFTVGIYLSKDKVIEPGKDRLIAGRKVPGLAAGAATKVQTKVQLPEDLAKGTYYIGLVVDPGRAVTEFNEANNVGISKNPLQVSR